MRPFRLYFGHNETGTDTCVDSLPVAVSDFVLRQVDGQIASWYWSGTEYAINSDNAWNFNMNNGNQNNNHQNNNGYGLALRSG